MNEVRVPPRAPKVVTRYVTEPAPAPQRVVDERHHTQVVEIPDAKIDKAWALASQKMVEAYPGTKQTLVNLVRLKDQILRGEPAQPGIAG